MYRRLPVIYYNIRSLFTAEQTVSAIQMATVGITSLWRDI